MMQKTWLVLALLPMFFTLPVKSEALKEGPWRFELQMERATVPFIVEFNYNKKRLEGKLHNGKETIPLKNITYVRNKLNVPLQSYEVSLELTQKSPTLLEGSWVRHNKKPKQVLSIKAVHGETERFPEKKEKPTINLTGKWAVTLTDSQGKETVGVLIFEQDGNYLSGSLLTPTGDYRFFEGHVSGNEFKTASFDGMYNYLINGKLEDEKLKASLLSNTAKSIQGKKDPNAALPDAYAQTKLPSLDFSFPDLKGNTVSLKDQRFKNKPVIVQIFGSWCPNCMDELNFLVPWYKKNKGRGIEVVALAFERSLSKEEAKRQLRKVQKQKNVPYPLLHAGSTAEDKPQEIIKGLQNFISFPTTVFLNRKHEVVKVHAGFTGPSTGEFYEQWKNEFEETVNALVAVESHI